MHGFDIATIKYLAMAGIINTTFTLILNPLLHTIKTVFPTFTYNLSRKTLFYAHHIRSSVQVCCNIIIKTGSRIQKEVLEVMEKRIDSNEKHLNMLMDNDRTQDETLATLESALPNLDEKLRALESADEFLQVIRCCKMFDIALPTYDRLIMK